MLKRLNSKFLKLALASVFVTSQVLAFGAVSTSAAATKTITSTIVVKAGQTYDGKGQKIIAKGMGDGSQDENQDPIFKLEKGAKLKNVVIGAPGCDGVHCYGNNVVENVTWEDVGEDALTVKGEGTVEIKGGSAKNASDKLFQINKASTFKVSNFKATNMGKFIRQLGGSTFTANIYIDSCTIDGAKEAIVRTDSKTTKVYYKNLKVTNTSTWWKVPSSSQVKPY